MPDTDITVIKMHSLFLYQSFARKQLYIAKSKIETKAMDIIPGEKQWFWSGAIEASYYRHDSPTKHFRWPLWITSKPFNMAGMENYYTSLNECDKVVYRQNIIYIDGIDPYIIPKQDLTDNVECYPSVLTLDIVNYP